MATLVVGANGATGRLLVEQLLSQGQKVSVIVRSAEALPEILKDNNLLTITVGSLLDMSDAELLKQVENCSAVVSCLGHNLTIKGLFGQPRRLVTEVAKKLCRAIERSTPRTRVKYILMNTTGNQNTQAGERVSIAESIVIRLIRHLLPPHADNELAAAYLQSNFGTYQKVIEWVAVRPDSLVDEAFVTKYDVYPSPIRSAIFDAGKTSRINVAHFMSELVIKNNVWEKWKCQMPVIYNTKM